MAQADPIQTVQRFTLSPHSWDCTTLVESST
jgi:hypothetical protein